MTSSNSDNRILMEVELFDNYIKVNRFEFSIENIRNKEFVVYEYVTNTYYRIKKLEDLYYLAMLLEDIEFVELYKRLTDSDYLSIYKNTVKDIRDNIKEYATNEFEREKLKKKLERVLNIKKKLVTLYNFSRLRKETDYIRFNNDSKIVEIFSRIYSKYLLMSIVEYQELYIYNTAYLTKDMYNVIVDLDTLKTYIEKAYNNVDVVRFIYKVNSKKIREFLKEAKEINISELKDYIEKVFEHYSKKYKGFARLDKLAIVVV